MPKFFVDEVTDDRVKIIGEDAVHISSVLRVKASDKILICDGFGYDYECVIKSSTRKSVTAQVIRKFKNENEPEFNIVLYQALPKSGKMELVIQKCVEIGVDTIVPIITEHTVAKPNDNKIQRYNKISEAAAKQCGRGKIPIVKKALSFKEAINDAKTSDGCIIPYEKETKNKLHDFTKQFTGKSIAVFIGPEGGFSDREIRYAIKSNVLPITLGKRILRTETAGLVTLVILMHELENSVDGGVV